MYCLIDIEESDGRLLGNILCSFLWIGYISIQIVTKDSQFTHITIVYSIVAKM